MKNILFTCLIMLLSTGLVSSNPNINVNANPSTVLTLPGGTATFDISVQSEYIYDVHVELSILGMPSTWSYGFNPEPLYVSPYMTEHSNLSINVPLSTPIGAYGYTLVAEEYAADPYDPFYFLCPVGGVLSCHDVPHVIQVTVEGPVSAPEFPVAVFLATALAPIFSFLLIKRGF